MRSVHILSNNREIFRQLTSFFGPDSLVNEAKNKKEAISMIQSRRCDFLFVDIEMFDSSETEDKDYKGFMQSFFDLYPTLDIIIISPLEKIRGAVTAVKEGARDYILYPIKSDDIDHVLKNLKKSLIIKSELDYFRDQFWEDESQEIIWTANDQMKTVYNKLKSVAPTISTVLLTGETGTGKGVLAKLIHQHSNRKGSQFISVHCGAIPDTLLESELFGHEKGAFTGAVKRKLGKFEIADHGTIFLDEIGTITPAAQIKLLQVLQDGTFQRVGGEVTISTDVRVIAATNLDLKQMCEKGLFRDDLYYRLNVFPVLIPPLRERTEDIPHLAAMFLERMNRLNTKGIKDTSPSVMEALIHYPWPGNIRELENLIERAYILENTSMLNPESFPSEIFDQLSDAPEKEYNSGSLAYVRRKGIEEIEKNYLKDLMAKTGGRIKQSAEIAGITTRQIHKLLTKYGIHKEDFKVKK